MNAVTIHPYLADLPVFDAEVEAIAESIREVGLLHPVTLDADGQVIGGRHRLAACKIAEVEPTFQVYEGDPESFMLHDNNARKHQSISQRAAEKALVLANGGRRAEGRWQYGDVISQGGEIAATERNYVSKCGLILDHLGRSALIDVALGQRTLSEAHVAAEHARDSAVELIAEQERIEAEEAAALASLPQEYAEQIGTTYSSARVAFAAWEDANRAEAARLRKEREREQQAKRDHAEAIKREAGTLQHWTAHYSLAAGLRDYQHRDEVLAAMLPKYRADFLAIEAVNDWRTA